MLFQGGIHHIVDPVKTKLFLLPFSCRPQVKNEFPTLFTEGYSSC